METRFAVLLLSELYICMLARSLTWFEAQTLCRRYNQTLTLNKNESHHYYWTAFYKRTSHWIKIIGCYNESQLQPISVYEADLQSSSPGHCQEICIKKNLLLFAVQARRCVCLSNEFAYLEIQLNPLKCNYSCDNNSLFSKECGGESTFNVFITDLSTLEMKSDCLSLQCGPNPNINDFLCHYYLHPMCSLTNMSNLHGSFPWRQGMEICKRENTYLIGNIMLSNITLVCAKLNNADPRWIGIVRDRYVRTEQGEVIAKSANRFFDSCEKCIDRKGKPHCVYEMCNTSLTANVYCSESSLIATLNTVEVEVTTLSIVKSTKDIATPLTVNDEDTTLTITNSIKEIYSRVVEIVVPIAVVLLLSICAVVVGIYYIRMVHVETLLLPLKGL
uniref:Uncharacterized protein LOC111106578 isoform X2 n=1 Tax=Crassostrea virginica TaxID=6565 RepID=A0A8B8B1V6_CRAVI|nr:uncharacterized protein LOC111106578 isoform X2 [Crassostrea virginica]